METREEIVRELDRLPEPLLTEVLDFVRFVARKAAGAGRETALASEPSLAKDWLSAEEDAAWQDL